MYKKILCVTAAFMLCTNIAFANPKKSLSDVDTISNSLNTVFLSVLQGKDINSIKKDIDFVQSELNRERNEILHEIQQAEDKDKSFYYSLLSVLNYYQISLLELQYYYQSNSHQLLISAISALNQGDLMLNVIKSKI
ncbi:hypothetical protein [Romboutsia lituseburensis]|uniref:hypothetical protein n=1 Tax=Romboutsia lituseburensis TaxID=1537 RepID=UPI00215AADD7|nr:hypothetical protein [Romboutsia lituseburensis]MCR8746899.1 hypothetical protein [Romboutsia lituseburensis]